MYTFQVVIIKSSHFQLTTIYYLLCDDNIKTLDIYWFIQITFKCHFTLLLFFKIYIRKYVTFLILLSIIKD